MTCLDDEGLAEIASLMDYYLENARILKEVRDEPNRHRPLIYKNACYVRYGCGILTQLFVTERVPKLISQLLIRCPHAMSFECHLCFRNLQ